MADVKKLEIGRVFRDTFSVMRGQAGPLVGLTLVLSTLPTILTTYLQASTMGAGATSSTPPNALLSLTATLVGAVLSLLMFAAQYHITIAALEGRRVDLREALRLGARKIWPLFAVSVLIGAGAALGALLFVVPGVILALMWSVATPVVVGEETSVTGALSRSRVLTEGNRLRILGLTLLAWLVLLVAIFVLGAIAGLLGLLAVGGQATTGAVIGAAVTSLVLSLPLSVGAAALYVQLRELKGGGAAVAQVFA